MPDKFYYTAADLCERFCISDATVRNWIKTGVLSGYADGNEGWTSAEFDEIVRKIESDPHRLKFRASRILSDMQNVAVIKEYDRQRQMLLISLINAYTHSGLAVDCAVRQLGQRLLQYNGFGESPLAGSTVGENIFKSFDIPNQNDDILGAFYQAVQTLGNKSKVGSFYTPPRLLNDIRIPDNCCVCDPCCGSGGILIRTLDRTHDPNLVWAFDIDETALFICRINLILFFGSTDINAHIMRYDWIFGNEMSDGALPKFDVIMTNPPWGSRFSLAEKQTIINLYTALKTTEASSISLFNAIRRLTDDGHLYIYLPESLLCVDAHSAIRKIITESHRSIDIKRFGVAFSGVQSECVLLSMSGVTEYPSVTVHDEMKSVRLDLSSITPPKYVIPTDVTQTDIDILNKIYNTSHTTLSAQTVFAMGIVTGNNDAHLSKNHYDGYEPVIRGRDIMPYRIAELNTFIRSGGAFQQTAPTEYYRRCKIVYRFISDRLVCALDNSGRLVLNSANIIIPADYSPTALVCLLNSSVYTYIYRKKFHSKKVLKSHLLAMPLPLLTAEKQNELETIYNDIIHNPDGQSKADRLIGEYFGLNEDELQWIIDN